MESITARPDLRRKLRPVEILGDIAKVPLTQGYCAIIDAEDVALISSWNWHLFRRPSGQLCAHRGFRLDGRRMSMAMHRQILGDDAHLFEHANGNGLDNRRANLLPLGSRTIGARRAAKRLARLDGGDAAPEKAKYYPTIQVAGRSLYLGVYESAKEARAARSGAAFALLGELAKSLKTETD